MPRHRLTLAEAGVAAVGFRAGADTDAEYGLLADEIERMVDGMRNPDADAMITVEAR